MVILIGGEVNQPAETIFDNKILRPPLVGSTAMKRRPYKRSALSWGRQYSSIFFNYTSTPEIWPDKRGDLCWKWLYKRRGLIIASIVVHLVRGGSQTPTKHEYFGEPLVLNHIVKTMQDNMYIHFPS